MKGDESTSNGTDAAEATSSTRSHRGGTYQRAVDSRKRPIRGLWIRNGKYYARLSVQDPAAGRKHVRRVRLKQEVEGANGAMNLEDVTSLVVAQQVFQKLKTQRDDKTLPTLKRAPKFSDYVDRYMEFHKQVKDGKRPDTLATEQSHLNAWVEHLGDARLDQINRAKINGFIAKRQAAGVSGRTLFIGYFEGLDSQRGIAWRCADSLALRTFLGISITEQTPVHVSMTMIRGRFLIDGQLAVGGKVDVFKHISTHDIESVTAHVVEFVDRLESVLHLRATDLTTASS